MSTKTAADFIKVLQNKLYLSIWTLDTDKVCIHFLIFRVSNMSYNIKIDSSSKKAESEGHEHVTLSFVIQGSEHSLLTQQEFKS